MEDKNDIVSGRQLTDKHINYSHLLLKAQFPGVHGLHSTLTLEKQPKIPVNDRSRYLQIVFCRGNHWITVSTIGCNKNCVTVYDSLYSSIDDTTMRLLYQLFGENVDVCMATCPKQNAVDDCGIFAVAISVGLAGTGNLPQSYTQEEMRSHMIDCFTNYTLTEFPECSK